jgi:hypothetical protein
MQLWRMAQLDGMVPSLCYHSCVMLISLLLTVEGLIVSTIDQGFTFQLRFDSKGIISLNYKSVPFDPATVGKDLWEVGHPYASSQHH